MFQMVHLIKNILVGMNGVNMIISVRLDNVDTKLTVNGRTKLFVGAIVNYSEAGEMVPYGLSCKRMRITYKMSKIIFAEKVN